MDKKIKSEDNQLIIDEIKLEILNLVAKFETLSEKEIQHIFHFFRFEFDSKISKVISTEEILKFL